MSHPEALGLRPEGTNGSIRDFDHLRLNKPLLARRAGSV